MPCGGLHSFLLKKALPKVLLISCVNALWRATLISTGVEDKDDYDNDGCQCPVAGYTHFYPTPLGTQYLCGFQVLFLQVFFRIFWQLSKTRGKSGQKINCTISDTIFEPFYIPIIPDSAEFAIECSLQFPVQFPVPIIQFPVCQFLV